MGSYRYPTEPLLESCGKGQVLVSSKHTIGIFLSVISTTSYRSFLPVRLADHILFGVTYTVFFSAAQPMGAILFWNRILGSRTQAVE